MTATVIRPHPGLKAIATRVKAIATRVEAIATRVEAIALSLEAITLRLQAMGWILVRPPSPTQWARSRFQRMERQHQAWRPPLPRRCNSSAVRGKAGRGRTVAWGEDGQRRREDSSMRPPAGPNNIRKMIHPFCMCCPWKILSKNLAACSFLTLLFFGPRLTLRQRHQDLLIVGH